MVENATHGWHEAHVSHTVCFVEYDPLNVGEIYIALLDQVLEAARAGNEYVDALFEQSPLLAVTDTAVDDADFHWLRERSKFDMDLIGEFAGRGKDQRGREVGTGLGQVGDDRDTKGNGLAGTRGGTSEYVSSGEAVNKRCGLDFEWCVDVSTRKRFAD